MGFLFIPGINNTRATFDCVRSAIPARHATATTDCAALPDVSAVAEVILKNAPAQFVAAGHSFGGYVALAILRAAPERVQGVVLINSNDWADTESLAASRLEKAIQADAGDYASLAAAASARAYHPSNVGRADLMAERAAALTGYGPARYAAHMRASATRADSTALLARCGKPILIVSGDADVVIPTARQIEMAQRLGADQITISEAGHMLPAEQPKALAEALTHWADTKFPAS